MSTNIVNFTGAFAQPHVANIQSRTTTKEASDVQLIEAIAAGEKAAMGVLFERHNARVYRFILRFVQDASTAEDLMSDVFLEVWRNADRFEGRSLISTWLLAIARNKAIEARRRRPTERLDDDVQKSIEDTADNPEVALEKKQSRSTLLICLTRLSPVHREIVNLIYYQGKSVDEAAKATGVPLNTVKTRLFYARKQLAGLLGSEGIIAAHA